MNDSNGSLIAVRCEPTNIHSGLRQVTFSCTRDLKAGNLKAHLNGAPSECSYEARAHGVKRNMRGDDARKACPDIQLVQASGCTWSVACIRHCLPCLAGSGI